MKASTKMRLGVTGAVLTALGWRLYFIRQFPFLDAGDTPIYQQLARNWLKHGIYGLKLGGRILPVDMRAPGYPAFLAAIYAVFGESWRAVMLAQAGMDVLTCVLAAGIAAVLAPQASRSRVALAALWLGAVCPFTANYTAVVLTETLATFLTALALLVLVEAVRDENGVNVFQAQRAGEVARASAPAGGDAVASGRNCCGIRDAGASGNTAGAGGSGRGAGVFVAAPGELEEIGARGELDGAGIDFAAAAVGRAKLARAARSAIFSAAVRRNAGGVCAEGILFVGKNVAVEIRRCVHRFVEFGRRRNSREGFAGVGVRFRSGKSARGEIACGV